MIQLSFDPLASEANVQAAAVQRFGPGAVQTIRMRVRLYYQADANPVTNPLEQDPNGVWKIGIDTWGTSKLLAQLEQLWQGPLGEGWLPVPMVLE